MGYYNPTIWENLLNSDRSAWDSVKDEEVIAPVYDNIFALTREQREAQGIPNLPENLKDALKEMRNDPLLYQVLGEHCYNKFLTAKDIEWEQFRTLVTEWELKTYLSR